MPGNTKIFFRAGLVQILFSQSGKEKTPKKQKKMEKKIVCLAVLNYSTYLHLCSLAKIRNYYPAEIIPYQLESTLGKIAISLF